MKRVITGFIGKNKDFRKWLKAQGHSNVVSLAEYRRKRKYRSKRAARVKPIKPSIA
jgi:hypothetical protein